MTIILCRCRSQHTPLHKAKPVALGLFKKTAVKLILFLLLTIEKNPKEFCRQLFKINMQGHAAVGRGREQALLGGAGKQCGGQEPRSGDGGSPGAAAAPCTLHWCNSMSRQTNSFKALCFISEKVFIKKKQQNNKTQTQSQAYICSCLHVALCFKNPCGNDSPLGYDLLSYTCISVDSNPTLCYIAIFYVCMSQNPTLISIVND